MNINIVGRGAFGSFLAELLPKFGFNLTEDAFSVILAVPLSAYKEVGERYKGQHLINICSVQKPSTDILLEYSEHVTSIHPLFGPRTPEDKRFSILTHRCHIGHEDVFLKMFDKIGGYGVSYPALHDKTMARTHLAAVQVARLAKPFILRAQDVPDCFIPNSFRLLREFVKTLDDMPAGTIESILANPYATPDPTTRAEPEAG